MLGYWGKRGGLAVVYAVPGRLLRIVVGRMHYLISFNKPIERMSRQEIDGVLRRQGVDPDALSARVKERLQKLRDEIQVEAGK
jgi:hypothetical protein